MGNFLIDAARQSVDEYSKKQVGLNLKDAKKAADKYGIEKLDKEGFKDLKRALENEKAAQKAKKDAAYAAAYKYEQPKQMVNRARPADTPMQQMKTPVTQGASTGGVARAGTMPNAGTTLLNFNDPRRRRTLLG